MTKTPVEYGVFVVFYGENLNKILIIPLDKERTGEYTFRCDVTNL